MQPEDYCRLLESDDLTLPCPIDNRHLQVALWSYWPQSAPSRSEIDETTGLIHAPPPLPNEPPTSSTTIFQNLFIIYFVVLLKAFEYYKNYSVQFGSDVKENVSFDHVCSCS